MHYNPEIHKRQSIRLKGYDYTQEGLYFITICIQNRECLFGNIINGRMELNPLGIIVNTYWVEIPNHYPQVELHEHIVMPNHLHGIIEIVGTCHGMSLQHPHERRFAKPISGSVSTIINQYKSSVKRWCNKNNYEYFRWQSRFYDHIIRNEQSYQTISNYIVNNPAKWQDDTFFNNI